MQEITTAVHSAIEKMVAEGSIETMIQTRIQKAVEGALDDAFKGYSEFGKKLSEHIKAGLQVDFSGLNLEGYHDFILKYIGKQLDASLQATAMRDIDERLRDLLAAPPAEIALSKLVAEFIETMNDDYHRDDADSITLIFERSDYGFFYIYLDAGERRDKYTCKYHLGINSAGELFSLKLDNSDPKNQLFVGPLYSFERALFRMHIAKSKVIFDVPIDEIDTAYPERHCEC